MLSPAIQLLTFFKKNSDEQKVGWFVFLRNFRQSLPLP